jgi:hypothetical protein
MDRRSGSERRTAIEDTIEVNRRRGIDRRNSAK